MSAGSSPFLSIILPVHNEEKRLPQTLDLVNGFVSRQNFPCEVLIVENGSSDRSFGIAEDFCASHPGFYVYHEEARGKGLAVRSGMLKAKGEYRIFCDVDFSMPVDEIARFLPPMQQNIDVVIGSRKLRERSGTTNLPTGISSAGYLTRWSG